MSQIKIQPDFYSETWNLYSQSVWTLSYGPAVVTLQINIITKDTIVYLNTLCHMTHGGHRDASPEKTDSPQQICTESVWRRWKETRKKMS